MEALRIRDETMGDHDVVRRLHLAAFSEPSPGRLADELRKSGDAVLSLVAEQNGRIVGHVLLSRLQAPMRALTLAPVGVDPKFQRRGVGSTLIREAQKRARQDGWQAIFVLGSPAYYGRFGFLAANAASYDGPYKGPDFMVQLLSDAVPRTGRLDFPAVFAEDIQQHQARQANRAAKQ
jgi:putative acetyltransferase